MISSKLEQGLGSKIPFKMWLYPLPALIAILMWLGIFFSTGEYFAFEGIAVMSIGAAMFFLRSFIKKEWPFEIRA